MDVNQLLESINQNINEGIYRSNESGIIYVNKAFAKMFGFENESSVYDQDKLNIYKNPEQRLNLINKLKSDGSFENEEVTFLKKGGDEFTGLVSSIIYEDEEGNIFWDGTIRDITGEKEQQRKARDRDQLLESINRNINEAIYRSVSSEGLVYVNQAFVKMFGYESVQDVLVEDAINLYRHAEEREELGDELVARGSVSNREVEFKRKDGSTFWGSLSSIKTTGDDGTIYFDGAIRDITRQKETEQELKHQAEMQKLLMKISTGYINLPLDKVEDSIKESLQELGEFASADRAYIFDIDFAKGTFTNTHEWCAPGVKPEIEYNQDLPIKLLNARIDLYVKGESFVIDDVSELGDDIFRKMLEDQKIKSLVSVPVMAGKYCVGFVGFDSVMAKHTYSKKDVGLLKLFAELLINIRTRSQNEKELGELLNTATNQNKRLKDFSYITSHNFRSSVANLLSLTEVMESDPGNSEYLGMFKITTQKLSEAIENLNELLNLENETAVLKKEDCNLLKTVGDVLELNNQTLKEKEITVELDVDKHLHIRGSSAYLVSIFHNIITNAIKYGTTDGSKKIEISAKRINKEVQVMVKDHGLGIDLNRFKDKIFKLGARFHSKEGVGQGLGLFMTKHQIEAMGGRIELESEVNTGTTFKVFFNGQ